MDSKSVVLIHTNLCSERRGNVIGTYLDILAVSCDSFDNETNKIIGRQQGSRDHLNSLRKVRQWCTKYKVLR